MTRLKTTAACSVHEEHRPASHINERHHEFPQWLAALATTPLPKTIAERKVVICSTGHNNVHEAINWYIENREWPVWLRAGQRALAHHAIDYCVQYGVDLDVARRHLRGGRAE